MTVRIAGWSGPRNRSTALMRSFEARGDCRVSDEPLYAHYLHETGIDHPMRDEVIASQPTDWRQVTARLVEDGTQPVWYQKHMSHHLLPSMGRSWMRHLRHVLWIRHPRAVVASYARKRASVEPADIGLVQQAELWRWLTERGIPVIVVDTDGLIGNPATALEQLCRWCGVPWTERMLTWPQGPRDTDGVWGAHWYGTVWASTGFGSPRSGSEEVGPLGPVVEALMPAWSFLAEKVEIG